MIFTKKKSVVSWSRRSHRRNATLEYPFGGKQYNGSNLKKFTLIAASLSNAIERKQFGVTQHNGSYLK